MGSALLELIIPLRVFTVRISTELDTVNSIIVSDVCFFKHQIYSKHIWTQKKCVIFVPAGQ